MSEINVKGHKNGVQVKGNVNWMCTHDAACDKWVGVCDDLNLTVQADTQRDLHKEIWEAMDTLFNMLVEENELENFLSKHGWNVEKPQRRALFDLPVNISGGVLEEAFA